ncbi:MAG: hypothetical protein ACR2L2_09060 [Acidobacteriota bacterium]
MKNADLRVYSVYVPILKADVESSVPAATARLSDERVTFFWDGNGELVEAYARVMKLGAGQPAWDIYFVFDRGIEWKAEPPVPTYWMHQLKLDPDRRLDGDKLAAEINKLLAGR